MQQNVINVNFSKTDQSDEATVHPSLNAQREAWAGTKGEWRIRVRTQETKREGDCKLRPVYHPLSKVSNSSST